MKKHSKSDKQKHVSSKSVKKNKKKNTQIVKTTQVEKEISESTLDPYVLEEISYLKTDKKWRDKQRTLVIGSRGIIHRHRHLMEDFKKIITHSKSEAKFEKKDTLYNLNELAESNSCNNCMYFETRRGKELYLWISRVPSGPSIKFQVLNIHTMGEIKLSGNCLAHSRPLLSFDAIFDTHTHLKLMKQFLVINFNTQRHHPKCQPFFDHVLNFNYLDEKIWIRHYQISPLTEKDANKPDKVSLTEIGPRLVLDPIKIFEGSFCGRVIYSNPHFQTPTQIRIRARKELGNRYAARKIAESEAQDRKKRRKKVDVSMPPLPTYTDINAKQL